MAGRIGNYVRQHHLALLCLFLIVGGGTAWALDRNSVRSRHIVNGQVKSSDAKNNGLTGTDIRESSLGQVPSAASVGGVRERAINFSVPTGESGAEMTPVNGLRVTAQCSVASSHLLFQGTSTGDRGTVFSYNKTDQASNVSFTDTVGANPEPIFPDDQVTGIAIMRRLSGASVEIDFSYRTLENGFGTTDDCFLTGFARSAP